MTDRLIEHRGDARALALRASQLPGTTETLRRRISVLVALAATAGAILVVHLPVLSHYFFGDDFVPLADIASRSTWGYVKDLLLLQDETPNWRFLTGLVYLGLYRAFGLDAFPFLLTNVLVHIGTAAVVFWLIRRVTGDLWPAFLGASFFGITSSYVPTVGQVTSFNNVLAGFFVVLALATLYEGLVRGRLGWWGAASAGSFAGAIAANESAAVLAPVLVLTVLWQASATDGWWRDRREWTRAALRSAPYVVLGGAALIGFSACQCTEAANEGLFGLGDHVVGNVWLYLGRLLYPVEMEPQGEASTAHLAAGIAVAVVAVAALVRGSALARIAVVFLALALVPSVPLKLWSAPRYTYMAAIPFSILAALVFAEAARYGSRLTPALPALLALVAFGVLGLYGWQTWDQNQAFAAKSADWRTLVTGIKRAYPEVPGGSTVYVHGGPLVNPLLQCEVLPAAGEVLWRDVKLFTFYTIYMPGYRIRPGYDVFVAEYRGDEIVPLRPPIPVASPEELNDERVVLLPAVSPDAEGNLCRGDTQRLP